MCRNIKVLFNFEPPANDAEVHNAALQFVRKISGFRTPSQANRAAFDAAVNQITAASRALLDALSTAAPPRDRDVEAARAKARAVRRFGAPAH